MKKITDLLRTCASGAITIISLTVGVLIGMTGRIPNALAYESGGFQRQSDTSTHRQLPSPTAACSDATANNMDRLSTQAPVPRLMPAPDCADSGSASCGVVKSIHAEQINKQIVDRDGAASLENLIALHVAAVSTGFAEDYRGHDARKAFRYVVNLRMADGTRRVIALVDKPDVSVGHWVRIKNSLVHAG